MGVDSASKINNLKDHFSAMFNFASQVPYSRKHLLPVVQAGKSIIGINPHNPPGNLLKWLEGYVKAFSPEIEGNCEKLNVDDPEIMDISKLGELVNSNNKFEALKYLNCINKVANPEYIAEYLMEIAARKSPFQLLFCWYIFKTIRNMANDSQSSLLELSMSCLMDEIENDNTSQFELICYCNQILDTTMIRMNSIAPLLNELVNAAKLEISGNCQNFIPQELVGLINEKREMGVWNYLSNLQVEKLNAELIIRLDAVRSAVRYSTNKNDWFMKKILKSQMKTEC